MDSGIAKYIDELNLALILISAALSLLFPFEVFVIAYLFIGPIHYLTESQWLSNKRLFVDSNKWSYLFVLCALGLILFNILESRMATTSLSSFFDQWSNSFILLAFALSAVLVFVKNIKSSIISFGLILILGFLLNRLNFYHLFLGILLPTLIHVFIFTWLFMIYGWKKHKTKTGLINVILLGLSPLIILLPSFSLGLNNEIVNNTFLQTGFQGLNTRLIEWLKLGFETSYALNSDVVIRVQAFISFVYLYHYLNWFSKTSVIGWHKSLSNKSTFYFGLIWIVIVAAYFIDFRIGFLASSFLSFVHVFLEFPLNFKTIQSLFTK